MLRHLAGTIILILFGISCAEKPSWTEVTFEHDSYIKVPLTINGDVHWYIFDTGAGVSTILSELAVKYNLRNEREEELAEKIEQGIKKKDSIGRFSVPAVLVPFCIGEKDFSKIDSSKVTNIFAVGVVLQAEHGGGHVELVAAEVDDTVLPAVAAALVTHGDAAVAVAAGVLLADLDEAALGPGVLVNAVKAGDGHRSPRRGGRPVSFNRHLSYPPLRHVLEDLDVLRILAQLDDSLFPGLRVALGIRASALFLALDGGRGDLDHGDAEDLLDCLLYLYLVRVLRNLEGVLLDVQVLHRLLGDDGTDDDIVSGSHQANTSSIFCSAALSTTSTRLLRIS